MYGIPVLNVLMELSLACGLWVKYLVLSAHSSVVCTFLSCLHIPQLCAFKVPTHGPIASIKFQVADPQFLNDDSWRTAASDSESDGESTVITQVLLRP